MSSFMRVEADINLDNIIDNVKMMKACVAEDTKMMVVIKADGYGHGAVEISRALDELADFYAVACIDEAVELRNAGCDKPLLILGYTAPEDFEEMIKYDVRTAIYDVEECKILSQKATALGKKAKIHIKLDTGMGRIGFPCTEEGIEAIVEIHRLPGIETEGIFTHYAKADEADKTAARLQQKRFREMTDRLLERGVTFPIRHISNSAGIMEMNNEGFDMVRSGIVTYGLYPSCEVDKHIAPLKPAMTWLSRVIHVKDVEPGTGIGYGWSFISDKKMKIATVSAGYADGYPRAQSNKGRVIINGEYAPVVGRVCMDQFMVDVSHIPQTKVGDKVILVGSDGDKTISVEEVAEPANSFNYELVCNVGRRVPRVYIKDGNVVSIVNYLDYSIKSHETT